MQIRLYRRWPTLLFEIIFRISLEINLRFRGCAVKYWNLPFTVEDFQESKQSLCVGSEMFLANPRKLFSFAIYITLSCQILDIVITLVVDETHQSGKRLKSQRNSSQVHIKQVCTIWVFLFYERTAKSIQRRQSKLFCFTFDFDETFLDCSTHEYYNLTKFRQNRL